MYSLSIVIEEDYRAVSLTFINEINQYKSMAQRPDMMQFCVVNKTKNQQQKYCNHEKDNTDHRHKHRFW